MATRRSPAKDGCYTYGDEDRWQIEMGTEPNGWWYVEAMHITANGKGEKYGKYWYGCKKSVLKGLHAALDALDAHHAKRMERSRVNLQQRTGKRPMKKSGAKA